MGGVFFLLAGNIVIKNLYRGTLSRVIYDGHPQFQAMDDPLTVVATL